MTLLPRSRAGRLGPVRIGQLVVVQLAVIATIAAYPQPPAVFVLVGLAALGLVGTAFARRRGRWWYLDVPNYWRLHRRRQAHRRAGGERLTPLTAALAVRETTDRGMRIGIGVDTDGWFAALRVSAPGLDDLLRVLLETGSPVSALQVVRHCVPVATVLAPAGEQTWVALRLAADDAPEQAGSRGGGVEGVHRALAATVGRVGKALRAAGLDRRPLTAGELIDALDAVSGWRGSELAASPVLPEHWNGWLGADAQHVCFQVTGSFVLADLERALPGTSALSTTLSVRVVPGEPARLHGLLRVAAGDGMAGTTAAEVTAVAAQVGCSLHRLDGAHGPALYAVAPTGH